MASPSRGSSNSYGYDRADADMGLDEQDEEDEDAKPVRPPSASALSFVGDMTVENTGFLNCGICFLALKPPIFQCDVGHVVCSPCRSKLLTAAAAASGRCPVCRNTTSFPRCNIMEQEVDSVRVPCPHAAQGCAARPTYHSRHAHAEACTYAPCHCPADTCAFVGPTPALLDHFADAHGWPCTAETSEDRTFDVHHHDGFNFLTAVRDGIPDQGTAATQHVFLFNVVLRPFGRTLSVVCLRPCSVAATSSSSSPPATTTTSRQLYLSYSCYEPDSRKHCVHSQVSWLEVPCVDPSDGLPDPNICCQYLIPNYGGVRFQGSKF
ncbi:hypothetical protein EJB05_33671, partial [Eragrostis curvula]